MYNRALCALQTAYPAPCLTFGAHHLVARMRRGSARVHPAIVQLSTRDICSAQRLCLADGDALVAQRRPAAPCTYGYAARGCANLHVTQQHTV
eukprot:2425260-Pleurochrysis_carterae.AAC.1